MLYLVIFSVVPHTTSLEGKQVLEGKCFSHFTGGVWQEINTGQLGFYSTYASIAHLGEK